MLRGYRLKQPKVRLTLVLLLAILLCAGWIAYGLLESAKYERESAAKADNYARYTSDKVAEACVGIPILERVKCLQEAEDAKAEYEYNQADLVAQRQSALWAYIMAAAAVIGMGLSVIGVWLVWTTFRETKRSADSAFATYNAFVALERASIKIHLDGAGEQNGRLVIGVHVTNIGKSSCLVKYFASHWQNTEKCDEIGAYIGKSKHVLLPHNEIKFVDWSVPKSDEKAEFLRGLIGYTSPLGEHRSHFCFRVLHESTADHSRYIFIDSKGGDWPADT